MAATATAAAVEEMTAAAAAAAAAAAPGAAVAGARAAERSNGASARPRQLVLFADIDGTLAHYPGPTELAELERSGGVLLLPPSATGRVGVISRATLGAIAALRATGVKVAILSGARTSTVLSRLPFLPAADAYAAENGGRIFYPDAGAVTAAPLAEDLEWRAELAPIAGPARQEGVAPCDRQGELWDAYRELAGAGWRVDATGYATAFRVLPTPGRTDADLAAALAAATAPPRRRLKASRNLGAADVYPALTGKEGAAARLLACWGAAPEDAAHMGDDDNDLALAAAVGRVFVPSVAEASVAAAAAAEPGKFVVSRLKWTAATEEMVAAAAAHFAALRGGQRGGC